MKQFFTNGILSVIFFLLYFTFEAGSQTLIMNEVSNGPAGNQEYVEFVVVSNTITYDCGSTTPPCIDIRGWIFDDNSGYHGASGVATGAVRFSQNTLWSCVPVGTIILIYNNGDRNPAIPADDLSLSDGNCRIIAPLNSTLFESNSVTPGAIACSYPATGWTSGGNWNNTLLANAGDCARIVNLAGCEVFSVCWASDNSNNLIYFSGSAAQKVYYFNNGNPTVQSNWSSGSASPSPGLQTPGAPNNAANASYIAQFNNGCVPITPINVTATAVNAGCICNGSATAAASGSIGGYTYIWYDASYNPIGQTAATATGLCAGTYHVIAHSSIGCTDTASVTLTSTSTSSVTANAAVVCQGQSASLTATPSAGGGTYSWMPGGQSTQTISVSPAATTTYTVTYTLAGCSSTATSTVTVTPLPAIAVSSPTVCAGQIAVLTASGGTSYSWSTGATINPLGVTPASTATYTVTGTNGGCSNTAISTVTVNPVPVVTVNSATVCPGSSALLTASGAISYTWSTGDVTNPVTVAPVSTTSYTVTGTAAGCSTIAVSTVTVSPATIVNVNSPTICIGQTANLAAGGASSYTWSAGVTVTGANTASVSSASTTSYTVTGTTAGCTGTAVATVTVNPLPVISINSDTICAGQAATLTATGGTTYAWNTGTTINPYTVSPLSTTTYTVTGTNVGCSATGTSTVTVNPVPVIIVNSTTICPGSSASLSASGGSSYTWSAGTTITGVNTATASPAVTNTYTVTGTTAGCSSTAVSTVTVNPATVVTVNSPAICNGQTANLSASGADSYTWSAGPAVTGTGTATVAPLTTTSYTVTGTTAGCSGTAVATVTVNPLPVISINQDTICAGQAAMLTAAGGTTYTWNTGSLANPLTISPAATTTYTVTGTTAGCSGTATATVTVMQAPVVTVNSATVCPGSTATLTAAGAATYTWSTGAGINSITVAPLSNTTYTVTGTTTGCSASAVSTVTLHTVLPVNTGADDSVCFGGNILLAANPNVAGFSYSWSPIAGLNNANIYNPTASPSATTTYVVTVIDTNACNASDSVTVYVDPQLSIAMSSTPVLCNGGTSGQASVIASGGSGIYSYLWTSNDVTATIHEGAGTYAVVVSDSWGCNSTDSITITEPAALAASSVSVNATCAGVCNGTATASATGGTTGATGYSYLWNTSPPQATATATGLCAGTYACTVKDLNNCSVVTIATITEPEPLLIDNMPVQNACPGGMVTLNATVHGGTGAYTYSWTPATGLSDPSINNPVATTAVTTVYTVHAADENGCSANAPVTVAVNPPLAVVTQNGASVCPGNSTILSATASFGSITGYTYAWLPAASLNNAALQSPQATPAVTTTYTVTATDACSSTATATETVTVLPLPTPVLTADIRSGCAPLCVAFTDTTGITPGTITNWNWTFGDGETGMLQSTSHCYPNDGSYAVALTVTGANGCSNTVMQNNYIQVFPLPEAAFTSDVTEANLFDPTIHFINETSGAVSYNWNFGDALTSTQVNPSHTYGDADTYPVWLVAATDKGCTDSVNHMIVIQGEFTFYAPNAFTPNDDLINNVFLPKGMGWDPDKYELMVFDRWGNSCFETKDVNKGWNGIVKNGSEVAQMDVYVWRVVLWDVFGKKHSYTGTVTIAK